MFDSLLITTDGSDCSGRAAQYGLELAACYDADVTFVHVLTDETDAMAEETSRSPADLADHLLDQFRGLAASVGVDSETHVERGTPATVITEYAATAGHDCIVMGRHGRAGIGERLLGTTTDRVLRRADVPVLTAPEGEGPVAYESLLLPTDGSENAERAAPVAGDIATRAGATLHLLSVVDVQAAAGAFDAGGISKEYVKRLTDEADAAVDSAAAQVGDVDTVERVRKGTPHEEIAAYVDENDIDLVVMATRGRSNLTGQYLGGTTDRTLRTVDAPVLVVR
ncbi:universal stress protein [Natronomonas sp. EA1]|uniref:universal stress protein n=1 Tax=Natronomonas sp. EA1 TaxID=3421655 RepID=UPI003EC0B002